MKRFATLSALFALGLLIGLNAVTITIGNGTHNQGWPFRTFYGFERSAALYTADQINATGFIDLVAWDCGITSGMIVPYKIWLKNTTDTSMTAQPWQVITATATLVKEGTYTPNTLGWHQFQLDFPFAYSGASLIILVETNHGEYGDGNQSVQAFKCTNTGEQRHQYWFLNTSEPIDPGTLTYNLPNIMMNFSSDTEDDLGAVDITGNPTPTVGEAASYTVSIRNNGSNAQSGYRVKLMDANNTELAAVNCPPINSGTTAEVEILWTPSIAGPTTIYGIVELMGDEIAQNDQTRVLELNVHPQGIQAVTIGSGLNWDHIPFNFYIGFSSLFQALYFPDELGFAEGTITSMAIYNRFTDYVGNATIQIFLGTTDQINLQHGFIPAGELTLVYEGDLFFPAGENTLNITFQSPYMYLGENLVVMFHRVFEIASYDGDNKFKCQTMGNDRACAFYSHNPIDPYAPMGRGYTGIFPQTTFFYTPQLIDSDLAVLNISGNSTPSVGAETNYTVTVRNNGSFSESNYTVKLMGPNNTVLASVAGPLINCLQTLDVTVPWTPTTEGAISIYGKVELDGDEVAHNNETTPILLDVQPEGTIAYTVGSGDELARIPINLHNYNSLFETLYYPDELGFENGTITSLAFHSQFHSPVSNLHIKIWLGSTTETDYLPIYIPANELTLVFDGTINIPIGDGLVNITLQTPFMYAGGNLVMMVNRLWQSVLHYGTCFFKCQTIDSIRSRDAFSTYENYDPYHPPTGTTVYRSPKVTFYCTSDPIEKDLAALSIMGNTTPIVGETSTYTIRIKNQGSETQSSYTVKLMRTNNTELASVAGPPISSQQILEVSVPWTPTATGDIDVYGKVILAGDIAPINDHTLPLSLDVLPAGMASITVGDGSQYTRFPIDVACRNSNYETLFYPSELNGFVGKITGLKFYPRFYHNITGIRCKVWLGTTTQDDLFAGWISSTQLTKVFDGILSFIPGDGETVTLLFDRPFTYTSDSNLVMLVHRPMDFSSYAPANGFWGQLGTRGRARYNGSGIIVYYPQDPVESYITDRFPKTTFLVTPGGVGQISGTVTDASNQPLSGVTISLNEGEYSTTTNDQGQYQLSNVLSSTYTLSLNKHGYYEHTQNFTLPINGDLCIDINLQPLPQVNVTGTVQANNTGAGLPGALITLGGYGSYNATTDATGVFTIAGVYADHTYAYNISSADYSAISGQITIGTTDYDMGCFTLIEASFAPVGVVAAVNDSSGTVNITWQTPDPNALELIESFEAETFPPAGWTQIITYIEDPTFPYNSWCRLGPTYVDGHPANPTDGNYQAVITWTVSPQNEWLITPNFLCPPNAYLKFDSYVLLGSDDTDHYYVKVSTDNGSTWTVLWDATEETGNWNEYEFPIIIDLSAYGGNSIKIAFHASDIRTYTALRHYWLIDNVYIGNGSISNRFDLDDGIGSMRRTFRAPTGYLVYRLRAGHEQNEASWICLSDEPVADLSFMDISWLSAPSGSYRWAVKALYSDDITSEASFSNVVNESVKKGIIVGTVEDANSNPITGATVTNGLFEANTYNTGTYTLIVPTGYHDLTVSAQGYQSQTMTQVLVEFGQTTTVNFVLDATSTDDPDIPVVATALNGNYPNPFNPETTISYSVKEAGRVRLEIYNIKGQLVRTLVDEDQTTGHYKQVFNSKDNRGRSISSGVYLILMTAPGYQKTSKMILMQ